MNMKNIESGIRFKLPDGSYFRLCDIEAYRKLSGQNLKEMDFGWWDEKLGKLFLLEVKEYRDFENKTKYSTRINELVKKATDALMIFSSVWSGTAKGGEIGKHLPQKAVKFPGAGKVHLIFLLNLRGEEIPITAKDEINSKLKGILSLFDIKRASVVNLEKAIKMNLPVEPAT